MVEENSDCPIRIKLVLSLLSGKSLKLKNIRKYEENPGLTDYEVDLLKLIDKVTNGTRIDINETGTSLYFVPGMLAGGNVEHDCKLERSIGYYLQVLMCLAPFCKHPIEVNLTGVTNDPEDVSIDLIKYSGLPILRRFLGNDDGLELKILKRGAKPLGGGQVVFSCPCKIKLVPINLTDPGKIKRIRGVAYAMRVPPTVCNRMIESAKGVFLKFLPDVYIVSDHQKGENAGKSPAFGITLVAETLNGVFLCAEACSLPKGTQKREPSVPEDVGVEAANNLLEEIYRGGCVDSANQHLAFLFMVLNQKDVSRILSGIFSPFSMHFMRGIYEYFTVKFKIEPCRNQEIDINHRKLLEEKEEAEREKKKKRKRNLQLPQEKLEDEQQQKTENVEEEENRKKLKMEEEEKEKNIKDYLKLGHEKLLMSCLGLGFTNLGKPIV